MPKENKRGAYVLAMILLISACLILNVPTAVTAITKITDSKLLYVSSIGIATLLWGAKMVLFGVHGYSQEFIDGWKQFYQKVKYLPFLAIAVWVIGISIYANK